MSPPAPIARTSLYVGFWSPGLLLWDGGISKDSPLIINCCCGRCDADKTCAPDSITGSGSWQLMNSPLCPAEGCGIEGWFVNIGYFFLLTSWLWLNHWLMSLESRCNQITKPFRRLSWQPWQKRTNHCRDWKIIEAWVHNLCCFPLWFFMWSPILPWFMWHFYMPWRLCQNHRWGRDNFDGQQLRPLQATNHNNQNKQSWDLFPHWWTQDIEWMESSLAGRGRRWVFS